MIKFDSLSQHERKALEEYLQSNRENILPASAIEQVKQYQKVEAQMLGEPTFDKETNRTEIPMVGLFCTKEESEFWYNLFGITTSICADDLRVMIADLEDLHLLYSSPGGDPQEGFACKTVLERHREKGHKVTASIRTGCSSAATLALYGAEETEIDEGAYMVFHGLTMMRFQFSFDYGRSDFWEQKIKNDYKEGMDMVKRMKSNDLVAARIYAKQTGMEIDDLLESHLKTDVTYRGQEAVDAGFVDALYEFNDEVGDGEGDGDEGKQKQAMSENKVPVPQPYFGGTILGRTF